MGVPANPRLETMKPIESRSLWSPTAQQPQGIVHCCMYVFIYVLTIYLGGYEIIFCLHDNSHIFQVPQIDLQ